MTLVELNARLARVCPIQRLAAEGAPHPRGHLIAISCVTADVDISVSLVAPSEADACAEAWRILWQRLDHALTQAQASLLTAKERTDREHEKFVRVLTLWTLARVEMR